MKNDKQKIGAGHFKGMLRVGGKEIGQALQAFPPNGIQPVEEQGVFGNLTPQEVAADKGYEAFFKSYADRLPQRELQKQMER